jgi:hypothetical protein
MRMEILCTDPVLLYELGIRRSLAGTTRGLTALATSQAAVRSCGKFRW